MNPIVRLLEQGFEILWSFYKYIGSRSGHEYGFDPFKGLGFRVLFV